MSKSKHRDLSKKDYEQIGRYMESVVEAGSANHKRLVKMNIIKGIATGAGSVIGASVVIVLLLWLLSLFSDIPFIGEVFEKIREAIKETPAA